MDFRTPSVAAARSGDCHQLQAGLMQTAAPAGSFARQRLLASQLTAAAAWGRLPAVRLLLQAGAASVNDSPNLPDKTFHADASLVSEAEDFFKGATALHVAIRRGHADVVSELLLCSASQRMIEARDEDGATPLADCCQHERPQLARLLLRWGADANAPCSRYQRRPLHWAAWSGDEALAKDLIKSGAVAGAQDWRGRTAADVADSAGHYRLARLLRNFQEQQFLTDAVSSNSPECLPLSRFRSESEPQQQQQQQLHQQGQQQALTNQLLPRHQQQQQQQPKMATSLGAAAINLSQSQPSSAFQQQQPHQQPTIPSISSQGWDSATIKLSQSQPSTAFGRSSSNNPCRRFTDPWLLPPQQPSKQASWQQPAYSITENPRGLCLVLSNENYAKLPLRSGTRQDADRIEQLFEQRLGFVVEQRTDLTGQQMLDEAAKAAKKTHRHRRADAFVCFLLAHGDSGGHVYGVDGARVSLNDIAAAFDVGKCPDLAGKPKAFFVQACRGDKEVMTAVSAPPPQSDGPAAGAQRLLHASPEGADFLFGFACCDNRPAYRHCDTGSIFIQTLCDVIDELLGDGDGPTAEVDVEDALTEVRRRICAAPIDQGGFGGSLGVFGQDNRQLYMVPEVRSTLRLRLRLGACD